MKKVLLFFIIFIFISCTKDDIELVQNNPFDMGSTKYMPPFINNKNDTIVYYNDTCRILVIADVTYGPIKQYYWKNISSGTIDTTSEPFVNILFSEPGVYLFEISAQDSIGLFTEKPDTFVIYAKLNEATLQSPIDSSLTDSQTVHFSWSPGFLRDSFCIYIDTVNPPVSMISSTKDSIITIKGLKNYKCRYYWQIESFGNSNATTKSAVNSFKIPSTAPYIDDIPDTLVKEFERFEITFNGNDDDGEIVQWRVKTLSFMPFMSSWMPIGDVDTTVKDVPNFSFYVMYREVVEVDCMDDAGLWSNHVTFIITGLDDGNRPELYPRDSTEIYSNDINFKWGRVYDAKNYSLLLDTIENPETIKALNITDTTYNVDSLLTNHRYFWRIRTITNAGDTILSNKGFSFTTM